MLGADEGGPYEGDVLEDDETSTDIPALLESVAFSPQVEPCFRLRQIPEAVREWARKNDIYLSCSVSDLAIPTVHWISSV